MTSPSSWKGLRRIRHGHTVAIGLLLTAFAFPAAAQDEPEIPWQVGPIDAQLGKMASVHVPEGYQFLDKDGTAKLMSLMGNPVSGNELGMLVPSAEEEHWSMFFEFDDIGYVKDDDKDELDANALLESIRSGNEKANEYRRKHGATPIEVVGWESEPRYNETTNLLEWCVRGQTEEHVILNHNTRVLGRHGVMSATLVVDPEDFARVLPVSADLLQGFSFTTGNRYAEYKKGDRIAEIGLTALVAGGAGALAMKTGLLKKFWKLIVLGVVAVGGAVTRFARRLLGRGEAEPTSPRA